MKVVQINNICDRGSTGKICVGISKVLNDIGVENYIFYSIGNSDYPYGIKCTEKLPKLQSLKSHFLGNYGFNSVKTTKKIIDKLNKIKPDLVHLHNLHGHNCNLKILMDYFRKNKTKLVWTFHDCWAFTAYCPHFVMAKCDKWRTGCHHCVQAKTFSWIFDRSEWLYKKKKEAFSNLDLTIVTPSQWLADLVKESFLKEYPVKVINNGIDLDIFKQKQSDFRNRYNISEDKFIILGVADMWVPRKGADVFIRLAEKLDSGKFQIVMVGTDDNVDKQLPEKIISIHRTQNQKELAEIYSAADLFVNPTREENYPTVNMEAIACGTPVLTFRTGGSPEIIDKNSGIAVECDDVDALEGKIKYIFNHVPFTDEMCLNKAKDFDINERFKEYVKLYKSVIS